MEETLSSSTLNSTPSLEHSNTPAALDCKAKVIRLYIDGFRFEDTNDFHRSASKFATCTERYFDCGLLPDRSRVESLFTEFASELFISNGVSEKDHAKPNFECPEEAVEQLVKPFKINNPILIFLAGYDVEKKGCICAVPYHSYLKKQKKTNFDFCARAATKKIWQSNSCDDFNVKFPSE